MNKTKINKMSKTTTVEAKPKAKRTPRKPRIAKAPVTKAGSEVLMITVEEHQKALKDLKDSFLAELHTASEDLISAKNQATKLEQSFVDLSELHSELKESVNPMATELLTLKKKVPTWVRRIFGVK